jgi:hypothetical protein
VLVTVDAMSTPMRTAEKSRVTKRIPDNAPSCDESGNFRLSTVA